MALTNAKVKFLRGTYANLQNQAVTDGNIYIATDERAMYVDYNNGTSNVRIRLGDFLQFASWSAIQAQSASGYSSEALYYAAAENILCKWTGTEWKQINAQKKFNQLLNDMSFDVSAASGSTATIALNVEYVDGASNVPYNTDELTYKLISTDTGVLRITKDTDANGIAQIKLTGRNTFWKNEIETAAQTYSDNYAYINLYGYEQGVAADGSTVARPSTWGANDLISRLRIVGENGTHVSATAASGNTPGTIKISTNFSYALGFSSGALTLTVTDENGNTTAGTASVTPTITIGHGTTTPVSFDNNGNATLDVYTASQLNNLIAEKLEGLNAMTFMGTVGGSTSTVQTLPLADNRVKIGDVYKVAAANTYIVNTGSTNYQQAAVVGDLFIAVTNSTDPTNTGEDANGYLTANYIQWEYVPSGNEESVVYTVDYNGTDKTFALTGNSNTQSGAAWKIGTGLETASVGSGSSQVVTISHKAYAAVTAVADSQAAKTVGTSAGVHTGNNGVAFTAITGLTLENGHITGISTGTFTVGSLETTPNMYSKLLNSANNTEMDSGANASSNRAVIKNQNNYADNTNTDGVDVVRLSSSSLTFKKASDDADLQIDLLWETF